MFFIDFNRMLVSCKFVGASYFALTTFTSAKSGAQHEKNLFLSLQDRVPNNDSEFFGEPP